MKSVWPQALTMITSAHATICSFSSLNLYGMQVLFIITSIRAAVCRFGILNLCGMQDLFTFTSTPAAVCRFSSLTFSWHIAHYGTIGNVSLPAASATGWWQVLRHSWTRRTLVCGTNAKNSTARLLTVKWIQLPLVFSWGFQPPQRVINLDPAF